MVPVKNQGDCGYVPNTCFFFRIQKVTKTLFYRVCWAFAAVAVLEYQIRTTRNVIVQLSEQELLDCNTDKMDCVSGKTRCTDKTFFFLQIVFGHTMTRVM